MNGYSENMICPVCGEKLVFGEKGSQCAHQHHFDMAKQGYVNLLLRSGPAEKRHGDDRLMLEARQSFLEKDFYRPLADLVAEAVSQYAAGEPVIADVGCGEGYYTENIYRQLTGGGKKPEIICVDISKEAAKRAAKRPFPKTAVVASAYELPIRDAGCDMVISIFAPFSTEETRRILKDGGIFIRVVPRERHLFGLKTGIYQVPYENPAVSQKLAGFQPLEARHLDYDLHLDAPADIDSLFKMTPYYYKTSVEDQEKAKALESLCTEVSFAVLIDRKGETADNECDKNG